MTHAFGLAVLPEYRGEGLPPGAPSVSWYLCRMVQKKDMVLLTCLDSRVPMYEKWDFRIRGAANLHGGGEEWHEMNYLGNRQIALKTSMEKPV